MAIGLGRSPGRDLDRNARGGWPSLVVRAGALRRRRRAHPPRPTPRRRLGVLRPRHRAELERVRRRVRDPGPGTGLGPAGWRADGHVRATGASSAGSCSSPSASTTRPATASPGWLRRLPTVTLVSAALFQVLVAAPVDTELEDYAGIDSPWTVPALAGAAAIISAAGGREPRPVPARVGLRAGRRRSAAPAARTASSCSGWWPARCRSARPSWRPSRCRTPATTGWPDRSSASAWSPCRWAPACRSCATGCTTSSGSSPTPRRTPCRPVR